MHTKVQPAAGGNTIFLDLQEGWEHLESSDPGLADELRVAEVAVNQHHINNILELRGGPGVVKVDPIMHRMVDINLFNGKETLYLGGSLGKIFEV